MYSTAIILALCLASIQASAIGRQAIDAVSTKDTVEYGENGISVKSGYEGYLLNNQRNPIEAKHVQTKKNSWLSPAKLDLYKALIMYGSSFLPAIGLKIVTGFIHFAIAVFVGIATTTAVCSFTPLCTISFAGSKPSFLGDKNELLPAIKEALDIVSRMNFLKPPVEPQPAQPVAETKAAVEETPEQIIQPRNPQKDVADENQNSKSAVEYNETKKK